MEWRTTIFMLTGPVCTQLVSCPDPTQLYEHHCKCSGLQTWVLHAPLTLHPSSVTACGRSSLSQWKWFNPRDSEELSTRTPAPHWIQYIHTDADLACHSHIIYLLWHHIHLKYIIHTSIVLHMWHYRIEIEDYFVTYFNRFTAFKALYHWTFVKGSYVLRRLIRYSSIFEARRNPAPEVQRCDQNTWWNNLWLPHGTVT